MLSDQTKHRPGAKQAAEKLDFSKSAKNGSCQDALRTVREGWLMGVHPPNIALRRPFGVFPQHVKAASL
jgi:hypothetical protein